MNDKTQLAAPGAGLPALELFLSRVGFAILRNTLSRQRIQDWLRSETERALAIARGIPFDRLKRPILVPRLTGIEDSSRNWSAAMLLQHLVIVDNGICMLFGALGANERFEREVRIADVKPSPEAGEEQFGALENALALYLEQSAAVENLHTTRRHAHPWFGPLDGHGWHTLAALHTMIHRRQLAAIAQALQAHPAPD